MSAVNRVFHLDSSSYSPPPTLTVPVLIRETSSNPSTPEKQSKLTAQKPLFSRVGQTERWPRNTTFGSPQVTTPNEGFIITLTETGVSLDIHPTDGGEKFSLLAGHEAAITAISCGPDYLATGDETGQIKLWSLNNWKCLQTLKKAGYPVVNIEWNEDGTQFTTQTKNGTRITWERDAPIENQILAKPTPQFVYTALFGRLKGIFKKQRGDNIPPNMLIVYIAKQALFDIQNIFLRSLDENGENESLHEEVVQGLLGRLVTLPREIREALTENRTNPAIQEVVQPFFENLGPSMKAKTFGDDIKNRLNVNATVQHFLKK